MKKLKSVPLLALTLAVVFNAAACGGAAFDYDAATDPVRYPAQNEYTPDLSGLDTFVLDKRGDFVIMQCADMHMKSDDGIQTAKNNVYPYLNHFIDEYAPDLLVLTGDNTSNSGGSLEPMRELADYLDGFAIPWAPVFGNHEHADFSGSGGVDAMAEIFESADNCLYKANTDIMRYSGDGGLINGNYTVSIKENGKLVYTLFMMDSGPEYSYFSEEQTDWYRETVETISRANYGAFDLATNKVVPSMLFAHLPVPEYEIAAKAILGGEGYGKIPDEYGSGENRETAIGQSKNIGFFELMKLYGTTNMFVGHRHTNSGSLMYENINLTFGVKTGENNAHDDDSVGATIITIGSRGVTVEQCYYKA